MMTRTFDIKSNRFISNKSNSVTAEKQSIIRDAGNIDNL